MNPVRKLHDRAMRYATGAILARHEGRDRRARRFARRGMRWERKAARLLPAEIVSEPTRSILYRSAASLAYQAGDNDEALRLIRSGLVQYTPPEIREELEALRSTILHGPVLV